MSENNGTAPSKAMGLRVILRTLRYRNYRLFFGGQGISLIGTWMQRIAMSWLVYRLTNSVFLLGVVGFFGLVPTFFLLPLQGFSLTGGTAAESWLPPNVCLCCRPEF